MFCNFIKKRLQHRFFPVNIPKVLGAAFFIVAAFATSFSIKKNYRKKVTAEIAFALINLFHVQIEEPASSSTTTRIFVFLATFAAFYYKMLKTRNQ